MSSCDEIFEQREERRINFRLLLTFLRYSDRFDQERRFILLLSEKLQVKVSFFALGHTPVPEDTSHFFLLG